MVISYAICSHNEYEYLSDLVGRLMNLVYRNGMPNFDYEVVILDDYSTDKTQRFLDEIIADTVGFSVYKRKHDGDFSAQKNHLNSLCRGDWIVNLDADEWLTQETMELIPQVIDANFGVEAYWLPRLNVVEGLTDEYIRKWNWKVSSVDGFDKPVVVWPDPQMRVYMNKPEIKWVNKVHERLTGFKRFSAFPMDPMYAIRHFKTIERQIAQNALYDKIARNE